MKPEDLLSKFGHSVNNPEFEKIFKFFEIEERPSAVLQGWVGLSINGVANKEKGIYFEFTTELGFKHNYGEIKSRFTREKYELFLDEITFGDNTQYLYQLPFGLSYDDDYTTIRKKIGGVLLSKSAAPGNKDHLVYCFLTTDYRIIVRLNTEKTIFFVRVFPLQINERKKIELKKSLKSQSINLSDSDRQKILELKNQLPTNDWLKSMSNGDTCFTVENIHDSEVLLTTFIDELIDAAIAKDSNKIYSALKKATKSFNKLQKKHKGFIETYEREQIIEFFERSIRMTSFKIAEGLDLTEDIREW